MSMDTHTPDRQTEPAAEGRPIGALPVRLPSPRASLVLAAVMLAIGLAVGAAIGPAPDSSFAGASSVVQRLPLILAGIRDTEGSASGPSATATNVQPPASEPEATPTPASSAGAKAKASKEARSTGSGSTGSSSEETSSKSKSTPTGKQTKLPPITNVWLIELNGISFAEAKTQAAAAPYIEGQLLPVATLLEGWSSLQGSAFASEAALAEPPAGDSTPPLLHSIVEPPCPEGAAGATCAPETPGQLTAADEFLKATLTQITGTSTYREHGLIVVTFANVGIATQSELPAGASTATLTYQPPAGVVLLSPFAKAGHSAAAFNPTSPRQSLEKLLR